MTVQQRGYAKGRATRESILDVASQVFAEVGYNGASLREIAARCGITHPGLIHHFATKADLLTAVLERRDDEDATRMAASARTATDLVPGLVELVAHNQTQRHIVDLYVALSAEATSPSHPAHEYFVRRYRMLRATLANGVRASQEAGTLPADLDPEATGAAIGALMDGLQVQWLLDPEHFDMAAVFAAAVARIVGPTPDEATVAP